jgi:TRAP-type C4-dicarboxylate transport system permease small subunit
MVEKIQVVCSWVTTLFVTFLIVTDIFLRFFFNRPLPATWEISEVIMPYIVLFAFAYALTTNVHVRVSLLTDRLPKKGRITCDMVSNLLSLGLCLMLTYWSGLRFWTSFLSGEEILAAVKIPWWIGKFGMPAAFATFGLRYIVIITKDIIDCR